MCENNQCDGIAPYGATVHGVAGMENEAIIVINEYTLNGDDYVEFVDERDNKRKSLLKSHIIFVGNDL